MAHSTDGFSERKASNEGIGSFSICHLMNECGTQRVEIVREEMEMNDERNLATFSLMIRF
jgi:hypothetical protein